MQDFFLYMERSLRSITAGFCIALVFLTSLLSLGQPAKSSHQQLLTLVERHEAEYREVSKEIWDTPELGYHEKKSSLLLQEHLRAAGFTIQAGVADEPTGFIASYGRGKPIIAILGEFDALPGLSQQLVAERKPISSDAPGHGCGHNLLGAGAALAAVSVRDYMVNNHIAGTLRFYGTPAEEGGSGKVYMVHQGLFNDVDVVLHWHPYDSNVVFNGGALAETSAKFVFHGTAAHASFAPEQGRSALDAVMLMGNGVEFLREHVPSNTRIHYTIPRGGTAPNVVPDLAEIYLTARNPSLPVLNDIWTRIVDITKGAALMTGTQVEVKIVSSDANVLPNNVLAHLVQKNFEEVGGFHMTEDQMGYARSLQATITGTETKDLDSTALIQPLRAADPNAPSPSFDLGDISWKVPTIGFWAATFPAGILPHTWQATASAGMSIGQDGMVVASKVLAITAVDLFENSDLILEANEELKRQLQGKKYQSAIPSGQKPVFDYRDN